MSPRFVIALLAASLLTPAAALAAGTVAAHDDVQYPNVAATLATSTDVIDTGDVDTTYPNADEPSQAARPAQQVAPARGEVAQSSDTGGSLACRCAHR